MDTKDERFHETCGEADCPKCSKLDPKSSNVRLKALPELLRAAERRVNRHIFGHGASLASIPANRDHDVDLLLVEAAKAIEDVLAERETQTSVGRPLCNCKGDECHGPTAAAEYGYRCRDSL